MHLHPAAACAVADVRRGVLAERVARLPAHQRERDRLEQRALATAVLAEQHQPGSGGRVRGDAWQLEVERPDHLEVVDDDALDSPRPPEVVLPGRRLGRDRVRVLRHLASVERRLHLCPARLAHVHDVGGDLLHRRDSLRRALQGRIDLAPAGTDPAVDELAADPRVGQPLREEALHVGRLGDGSRRIEPALELLPLDAYLLERGGTVSDEAAAVETEHLDRRLALRRHARQGPVLGVDEMLLRLVTPRVEQQRQLGEEVVSDRARRRTWRPNREASALEAQAVVAAGVEVLPGVGKPPVVVGARRPVQLQRAARRAQVVDEHVAEGQRHIAVGALAAEDFEQPGAHVLGREHVLLEGERVLAPLLRGAAEERRCARTGIVGDRRGEQLWCAGRIGGRANHRGVPRRRLAGRSRHGSPHRSSRSTTPMLRKGAVAVERATTTGWKIGARPFRAGVREASEFGKRRRGGRLPRR